MTDAKDLLTIKKLADLTGASERFLLHLLEEGRLTKYKINSATFISRVEFEQIAIRISKNKMQEV